MLRLKIGDAANDIKKGQMWALCGGRVGIGDQPIWILRGRKCLTSRFCVDYRHDVPGISHGNREINFLHLLSAAHRNDSQGLLPQVCNPLQC